MPMITFTYFKSTGKYYAEGYIDVLSTFFDDITLHDYVKELRARGTRPGLVDGKNCQFIWHVQCDDNPPHLWFPGD